MSDGARTKNSHVDFREKEGILLCAVQCMPIVSRECDAKDMKYTVSCSVVWLSGTIRAMPKASYFGEQQT